MKTQTKKISALKKLLFVAACSLLLANVQAQTMDTIVVAGEEDVLVELFIADTDTLRRRVDTIQKIEEDIWPFCRHEFSIWSSFGASTLHYKPTLGSREIKPGGAFGLGYTFYFNRNWGIRTGAEVAVYNTTFRLRMLRDSYTRYGFDDLTPGWSGTDELIDYHTEISNYTEKQRLFNLNVPLLLQFQTPLAGGNHRFFASAGLKLGLPISNTYKVSNATLYTWYYDHKTNQEFRPDPTSYGMPFLEDLGCFYNIPFSTRRIDHRVRISGMASAEAGVKFHLSPRHSLYVGAYLDYGFNNIVRQNNNRFFEFDPQNVEMFSNSVLSSQYTANNNPVANFTNHVVPLAFGLTVRLGINVCPMPQRQRVSREVPAPPKKININLKCVTECKCRCVRANCGCCEACEQPQQPAQQNNAPTERTVRTGGTERPRGAERPERPERPAVCTWMEDAERERAEREYGELEDLIILHMSGYDINQSRLTPIMIRVLDEKIDYLQRYNSPEYIIICEGHTCDIGNTTVNMRLGRRRAEVVREHLIRNGFDRRNIRVETKGSTMPLIENVDEAHRRINRRVVFLIQRVN